LIRIRLIRFLEASFGLLTDPVRYLSFGRLRYSGYPASAHPVCILSSLNFGVLRFDSVRYVLVLYFEVFQSFWVQVYKNVWVQFEGGVIIAADTLGSYGSLAKITNLERVIKVNH